MKTYGGVELQHHVFLTSVLDGGGWSASRPWRFTPGENPTAPIGSETGWAPEPPWMRWQREETPAPAEYRTPVVQLVTQSLYWLSYRSSCYSGVNIKSHTPEFPETWFFTLTQW